MATKTGAGLIADERRRQIEQEGWAAEHDDQHAKGELAAAARCYQKCEGPDEAVPDTWPWAPEWWTPSTRLRNLVKAGALYQAEHDRIDRQGREYGFAADVFIRVVNSIAADIDKLLAAEPQEAQ